MKKSMASKKGSCLSFMTSGVCRDESSLQLMRISLKKEGDRRERLQKLLSKYESIRGTQKSHIKIIKANIIELKDVATVPKIRFLVDPNIYVDNNLSVQTRQFLCMLLNTFYMRYEQNTDFQVRTGKITDNIRSLIKSISYNEQLLFKVQKQNINHQVQLEGELLSQKNKLKEEGVKAKDLDIQQKRVKVIWMEHKKKFQEQKQKVDELTRIARELENKIMGLNQKINQGEEIRQGNQDKLSGQMVYQMKFQEEVSHLKQAITEELARQKVLRKKITDKKLKIDKLRGHNNYDNNRHQIQLKLLQIAQPRSSTRHHGVANILDIEKSFAKSFLQTQSSNSQPFL